MMDRNNPGNKSTKSDEVNIFNKDFKKDADRIFREIKQHDYPSTIKKIIEEGLIKAHNEAIDGLRSYGLNVHPIKRIVD